MEKQTDKLIKSANVFVDTFIKEYGKQGAIDKLRKLTEGRLTNQQDLEKLQRQVDLLTLE